MFDGVEDQGPEVFDGLGEAGEGGEATSLGPGDPSAQQGLRGVQVAAGEDLAELFFEQVGPVEATVDLGDAGDGGALVTGEVRGVFSAVPTGCP